MGLQHWCQDALDRAESLGATPAMREALQLIEQRQAPPPAVFVHDDGVCEFKWSLAVLYTSGTRPPLVLVDNGTEFVVGAWEAAVFDRRSATH